jgi:hypothetical protein
MSRNRSYFSLNPALPIIIVIPQAPLAEDLGIR